MRLKFVWVYTDVEGLMAAVTKVNMWQWPGKFFDRANAEGRAVFSAKGWLFSA